MTEVKNSFEHTGDRRDVEGDLTDFQSVLLFSPTCPPVVRGEANAYNSADSETH